MKPTGEVARKSDYTFRPIEHAIGAAFIVKHHYAKGCSKTGNMFGMFKRVPVETEIGLFVAEEVLVGVAQWLPPTRVCAESVNKEWWRRVISLTRLAVAPSEPQNCASMLIGAAIRWLKAEGYWVSLVTYADPSQGHTGAIYKATNWTCLGVTKARHTRWVDAEGRQVAIKCAGKTRTRAEMLALGYIDTGTYAKVKYIMHIQPKYAPESELTQGAGSPATSSDPNAKTGPFYENAHFARLRTKHLIQNSRLF